MGKIFILPDRVSNRIAAGEVVDKPASVVKELVENSIDSGAKEIEIRIEGSGRKLIQVSDNGCGMDYDDAIISLERHSTSKIKNPEDLDSISTLGFRGEALASIASVSRLMLLTKTGDESAATRVEVAGGKLVKVEKAAREAGTTIRVEDLFFNTPARLKFLKSDSAEMRWIVRILTNYSIIYKDIKFTVFEGGKVLFRVPPSKSLFERIHSLAGAELARALLAFDGKNGEVRAFGYCSNTNHKRSSRDGLHFYINGRSVDDKLISSSVAAAYKTLIPPGSYPSVFLFIELPFDQVDVNVHPAKTEVRFKSPNVVRRLIEDSIRTALIKSSPVLNIKAGAEDGFIKKTGEEKHETASRKGGFSAYLADGLTGIEMDTGKERETGKTGSAVEDSIGSSQKKSAESHAPSAEGESSKKAFPGLQHPPHFHSIPSRLQEWTPDRPAEALDMDSRLIPDLKETQIRVIGQLLNSFIIVQGDEDLLIIDQHIAHERVRYEQLKEQFAARRIESQSLLIPETFEVTREDDIALKDLAARLAPLGFQIEPFGGRTWAVKAIPVETETSGESIVREMIDLFEDVKSSGREGDLQEILNDELIALISCHGSIKKNMPLTKDKMEWLISQLALCKEPYRCPHGRPVILRIERNELFKKFGRNIH